jgi:fructokinase
MVREMIRHASAGGPDRVEGPFLGSPPAYCSVAAARLGTATGVVTRIGSDMPAALLEPLVAAGVDMAGIARGAVTTATELIYDAQGHKEIRYPAKAEPITARDVPASWSGCRMIYVCPMDNDVPPAEMAAVVALGQAGAVDLGGYGGVHMSLAHRQEVGDLRALALDVARHLQIVKASDEDARSIFGASDPMVSARELLAVGPQVVLITLGALGVLVCTREGCQRVPALPAAVRDTTGGGDTFMAGFLSAWLAAATPGKRALAQAVAAARWGCATASWVIEKTGGVHVERMPTRAQVRQRAEDSSAPGE